MAATITQLEALRVYREQGENSTKAAKVLGKSPRTVQELVGKALKWEQVDAGVSASMASTGIGIGSIDGGWRITEEIDPLTGLKIRNSVRYSVKGQKVNSGDLADAIKLALADLTPRGSITPPENLPEKLCNFIPLCDLHVGGEYGDPNYLDVVHKSITRLISGIPKAKKAVLLDMGDLLDANDHHGLTPASGNECDVIRENHLKNTVDAMNIMRHAIELLAQTHEEVEVHLLRGNHDETAYIGVMVALATFYKDTPSVNIILSDDNFRVIEWGKCAVFPHHGDKCKWEVLKDVFADQFCDAWTRAKFWRFIWTAHVHHDKARELGGAMGEHFRTLAKPNNWAQMKGLFARGSIQCVTLHTEDGETDRKKVNLPPLLLQDDKSRKISI
jgi:hypothetical protein